MDFIKRLIEMINANTIVKNIVLAICGIVVFFFVVSILLNIFTRHNQNEEVPEFIGLTMEQAKKVAPKESFSIEVNDSLFVPSLAGGVILDQLPKSTTKVKSGRRVFVTVNSFRQKMVIIPYVAGFSLRQAKNNLEVAGLSIDELIFRPNMASNYVIEQQFGGKTITAKSKMEVEQGSGITLIVGMNGGEPLPTVPKVTESLLRDAKSRIWESGLNVGKINTGEGITIMNRNEAIVSKQTPAAGARVHPGTPVEITLTLVADKNSAR